MEMGRHRWAIAVEVCGRKNGQNRMEYGVMLQSSPAFGLPDLTPPMGMVPMSRRLGTFRNNI